MSDPEIDFVRAVEQRAKEYEQVSIETHHVLHGGVYTRTIRIPAGVLIVGALIRVPTTLIVSGDCFTYIGQQAQRVQGHAVLPASANRKQFFAAVTDTMLTMSFRTDAKTVEQAEEEFTSEVDSLLSRQVPQSNIYVVTGE